LVLNKSTRCWIKIVIHSDGPKEGFLEDKVCGYNIMTEDIRHNKLLKNICSDGIQTLSRFDHFSSFYTLKMQDIYRQLKASGLRMKIQRYH